MKNLLGKGPSRRGERMDRILLAAKRLWRGKALPAFCLLLMAAVFASSFLADADSLTPAGVCDLDGSPVSRAVTARLTDDGFLPYGSEADLRRDLFAHMESLSFSFFDRNRTGVLMSRVTNDLFEITELAHHGPEDLFISTVTLIGAFCIMCTIDWRLALARGKLDAAVLLPEGFGNALLSDDPAGCALFLTASGAFVPDLFRNQAAAALFAEKTPYRTADALREAGADIPAEEVFREYRSMTDAGTLFSFRIAWEDAGGEETERLPPSYVMGALGILLTAGVILGTAGLLSPKACEPAGRIGGKRAFLTLTLPSCAVQFVSYGLSVTAGLLSAACFGHRECLGLILPAWIFLLLLTGASALMQSVLQRSEAVYGFLFAETVLSLLLLPLWADAALLFPVLGKLRILLPPWWLWLSADHPVLCLLIALPLCAAGGFVLRRELTRRALKQ